MLPVSVFTWGLGHQYLNVGVGTQTFSPYHEVNRKLLLKLTYLSSLLPLWLSWYKNPPAMRETWVLSLGWEDPLEKGTATHSSILAWIIPWTVKSLGSKRVGHNWMTFTFTSVPYPTQCLAFKKKLQTNLSHGPVTKNLPDNAGDTVWSLYCKDPTCDRASKPMCHNYWAQALECGSHNCWSLCIQKLYSATREATQWEAHASHRRVNPTCYN